jgi:hypothetical protein
LTNMWQDTTGEQDKDYVSAFTDFCETGLR